jgi:MarR family transcriptional regulator, negative regulator of the multidrug operon emrRAB
VRDRTANLLGAFGLAVADRIAGGARAILQHAGETAAALVVIGYGLGPSNEQLRRVLRLSHPGSVRLVDRLVGDGLVERRQGRDKRAIALHLTHNGIEMREKLLTGRLAALRPMLEPLTDQEQAMLGTLLEKMLPALGQTDWDRRTICRFCDDSLCTDCPIPADFRKRAVEN